MSKHDEGYSGSSFWQLIIAIPGTILAFTLIISLLAYFFGKPAHTPATAAAETAEVAKVEESIKPVAEVEVAAASAGPHVNKSGEEVTKAVCAMCHAAGLMAAPMIGNKEQWAPRIAQGYEALVKHAIEGIRNMPARGGNPDLTDGKSLMQLHIWLTHQVQNLRHQKLSQQKQLQQLQRLLQQSQHLQVNF